MLLAAGALACSLAAARALVVLAGDPCLREPRTQRAALRGTGHQKHEEEQPKKRRCSPSWARLIAKVFQTDPLVCRRCGGPLKVVAYIAETVAIRRILDHLGLSPLEKPPPDVREVVRVPVDDQRREIGASRA